MTRNDLYYRLIVILIVSLLLIPFGLNQCDKQIVINDYDQTLGWIIDYNEFGIGPNTYLTYEFIVGNYKYSREINGPYIKFPECEDDIKLCKDKRFLVIYSKKNPKKSLINLTREFKKGDIPSMPSELKNFQ